MAEPFAKPKKEDIAKLMKLAEDNICFFAMNSGLKSIQELGKDGKMISLQDFYRDCRLMLINYPAIEVYEQLDKAVEDIANDTYKNLSVPNLEEETTIINPIYFNPKESIIKMAKDYGIKVKKNKAVCPFHADSEPSLTFYPENNTFFCFGCRAGGDVITFIQKLEELKNGYKK